MMRVVCYFAYGSNLGLRRLRARVPSAEPLGTALLVGHRLCFHKIGRDGSGKCDALLTAHENDRVEGRVFHLDPAEVRDLDRAEGLGLGYERRGVRVATADGGTVDAFAYFATRIDARLDPFDWYKLHVLRGAREAGLSPGYRAVIEAVRSRIDRDGARATRELSIYVSDPSRRR